MAVIPLLPLGANSIPVYLWVEDDLKELQLDLLHQLLIQRWRLPQRHRLQINNGLLQIQQPQPLHQVPLLLLEAERLYAISVTAVGTLLPNVQAVGPCC